MTTKRRTKMRLTLGRVRGNHAAEAVCRLVEVAYPKLKAGRIPVEYDDTVPIYLIDVTSEYLRKGDVAPVRAYVRGVVDSLVRLDVTTFAQVRHLSEDGVLTKTS